MRTRKAIVSAVAFAVTGLALVGCSDSSASGTSGSSDDAMSAQRIGSYRDDPNSARNYSNSEPETPGAAARPAGGTISGSSDGGRLEPVPSGQSTQDTRSGSMNGTPAGSGSPSQPNQSTDAEDIHRIPTNGPSDPTNQGQDLNALPAGSVLPATQQSTGGQSDSWTHDNMSGSGKSQTGTGGSDSILDQTGQPAGANLPGQTPTTRSSTTQPSANSMMWGNMPDSGTSPGTAGPSTGNLAQPAGAALPEHPTTLPAQQ